MYSVPCGDCGVRYIGETGQHFCDIKTKHQTDIKSVNTTNGYFNHNKEIPGHNIDWDKMDEKTGREAK